jgi:hypothetical protein
MLPEDGAWQPPARPTLATGLGTSTMAVPLSNRDRLAGREAHSGVHRNCVDVMQLCLTG